MRTRQEPSPAACTIAFVASCLNEKGNVRELHHRCRAAFESFAAEHPRPGGWAFRMTLADNGSSDGTAERLEELAGADASLQVLVNARNYGPEPSVVHALASTQADVYVLLASDLQDPPELVAAMLPWVAGEGAGCDAVLACKRSLPRGPLVNAGRAIYYRLLEFGTRTQRVPNGFHGFGVYRAEVIEDTVAVWRHSAMSLRQAMVLSAHAFRLHPYDLQDRVSGRSNYRLLSYVAEALASVFAGEAITTRVTMRVGLLVMAGAMLVGGAIVFNVARGGSGYAAGTPTIMLLVLISLGVQSLLLSMLSYQIENLNLPIRRPVVRSRRGDRHGLQR